MQPTERRVHPLINHTIENSGNFLSFSTYQECEKEQTEYSYFKLEKVFGARKASFINRLNYWLIKCGRDIESLSGKWIYNPLHAWTKQLNCSPSTVKRLIKSLEEQGVVLSKKVNAKKYNQTKWYSLNYRMLKSILKLEKSDTKVSEKKRTNRIVQKEPIIISNNRNNYTNTSSYIEHSINLNRMPDKKIEEIKINSNEKEMINKMLYVWNKVFEYSVNPIKAYSNQKKQQTFLHLYKTVFNNDLDSWREYAIKINSSQFLMGEKKTRNNFKAVFSWLIKPDTIEKILNGEYGVGDRELDMNNILKNIEEKKEDIVNKMDKKLSEYMKIKINDGKEREEFKEYVGKTSITEDDSYGILKNIIKQVPKNYILEREEYKGIKENLYESFVMKKYLGYTKLDIRKKIREKTREIDETTNIKDKMMILREIEERIKTKQLIDGNTQNNEEMENYNFGLLESMLLSNSKKESKNLKDSSGESSIRDIV